MTRPFAIYYGWPSSVNGSGGTTAQAVAAFAGYRIVVFGEGNIMPGADPNIGGIMSRIAAGGGTPYGYVTIGVTDGEPGYSLQAIRQYLDAWKSLGAAGVLLDCAGKDYGVSRQRFDAVVQYAHSLGMHVLANAWNPDDVLAGSTPMGRGDSYLGENDVLSDGKFLNPADYGPKLAKMASYKRSLGIALYETSTTRDFGDAEGLTARTLEILAPYGIDGFQLTDPEYSSTNNLLRRPATTLTTGP